LSNKLGARHFLAATADAMRQQGRAMLAAAPLSLALFILSLPFALLITNLFPYGNGLFMALALINLIALARMTCAWHRVVQPADLTDVGATRGSAAQARHLALLCALVIAGTAMARATGDLPYVIYMVLAGSNDAVFWSVLCAALALIWVPTLYALAMYGLSLPRAAVAGEYRFHAARAAMPYKPWPLMLALLMLIAAAGHAGYILGMLAYGYPDVGLARAAMSALLCVPLVFVVATMYAVAYRDSCEPAARTLSSRS